MEIKKKPKTTSSTSLFLLCIGLGVTNCNTPTEEEFNLTEKYISMVADFRDHKDNERTFNFDQLSEFEWNRMFIFKPYSPIETVNDKIGFKWDQAESTLINQSDDFNLIVFVIDDKNVRYCRLPRNEGDFIKLDSSGPFYSNNSSFILRKEKNGEQDWIFVYKKR